MLAVRTDRPRHLPETREQQVQRAALRRRMRDLDISVPRTAALVGVTDKMLHKLLDGSVRTSHVLGYDKWPEHVTTALDKYEQSLVILHAGAQEISDALTKQGLPVPAQLLACLPKKLRSRRAAR